MNVIISIRTYRRADLLQRLLWQLEGQGAYIIVHQDGGEQYPPIYGVDEFHVNHHRGKKLHWALWNDCDKAISKHSPEYVIYLPDDAEVSETFVKDAIAQFNASNCVALNLLNDGRSNSMQWNSPESYILNGVHITGWVDCCFVAKWESIKGIAYSDMSPSWWSNPDRSTGVGYQQTAYLRKKGKLGMVVNTLVGHSDHISQLHPTHRVKTPLISKLK